VVLGVCDGRRAVGGRGSGSPPELAWMGMERDQTGAGPLIQSGDGDAHCCGAYLAFRLMREADQGGAFGAVEAGGSFGSLLELGATDRFPHPCWRVAAPCDASALMISTKAGGVLVMKGESCGLRRRDLHRNHIGRPSLGAGRCTLQNAHGC